MLRSQRVNEPGPDLVEIRIETTDLGPLFEDAEWVFRFADGSEVREPNGSIGVHLPRLQQLPGFDNDAVIEAMSCVDNRTFVVWKKPVS
jgi:hypothetical protein